MLELLVKGQYVTLLDECDESLFQSFSWTIQLSGSAKKPYVVTSTYPRIGLHRLILNAPEDKEVDHHNGNSLDNRRKNLRPATRAQNAQNTPGLGKKLAVHPPEYP